MIKSVNTLFGSHPAASQRSTRGKIRALALAALFLELGAGRAIPEQIVNGGFEEPVTATLIEPSAPNSTTIPGRTIVSGSVDVVNAAGNGFDVGPAYQGAQYLDLNGDNAGTIAQTFSTSPGATYLLSFAYANNYDPPTSLTALVTVADGSGTLLSTSVTHSNSFSGNLNWKLFDQSFTANQSSATLTFASQNTGDGGVFLDAVSVIPQELPTLAIALSGSQAAISWTTNALNFQLISTPSLTPVIHWTAVTNQPVTNGAFFVVNVQITNSAQFFELESP
jgi:hypothetical protein